MTLIYQNSATLLAPGFNETGTFKRGSKADLTTRVLSHARGNAARDVLE